ncbi:MAG: SMC family ATPase [Actinobacteria bacterium]|nr:SMC family ATPase [Actinomycetota bacterium]
MRPVSLRMKGFTAFRDEQAIDFDGLDLFAIVGPTGSGKSSVLDAITYALFGVVDRVDKKSVRQMVSQGQPRMAVTLEFEVGEARYRVTRSMPSGGGGSKVQVELREDGDWRQAGEGSDRVKDADAMLRGLVGLDFEAFTRSVLLPQGKFAEFMTGDAAERRDILTELLDLGYFERMARHARALARDDYARAGAKQELIGTQYLGVTPEALEDARRRAAAAVERERGLAAAEDAVRKVHDRWERSAAEVDAIRSCAADVRDGAGRARGAAVTLADVAAGMAEASSRLEAGRADVQAAVEEHELAAKSRAEAEAAWGGAADLAALRVRAEGLAAAERSLEEVRAELERTEAARPGLEAVGEAARSGVARAEEAMAEAEEAVEAAERAREEVLHADRVAAVVAGLSVGDPCPVCGEPLREVPAGPAAARLKAAERELAVARTGRERAGRGLEEAREATRKAESALAEDDRERDRLNRGAREADTSLAALRKELTAALGGPARGARRAALPDDPVAEVVRREEALGGLVDAERASEPRLRQAEERLRAAEGSRESLLAGAATERARLETLGAEALAGRAAAAAGPGLPVPEVAGELPPADDPKALLEAAGALADALEGLAVALSSAADARAAAEGELLEEAAGLVDGLVDASAAGSLAELLQAVAAEAKVAVEARVQVEQETEHLERDLGRLGEIQAELRALRARVEVYQALGRELQADRLISFLQGEALRLLAVAGSARLSELSGGRYELVYREDRFEVVDRWNGDEARSVRTLSGGETFLASLALALALAEQVRTLAVTDRASLDSLFLDEGFGALDPEALEVVVEALEQLGGDGRMVGVITHVRELADRMPVRIEVQKSPRGSRLLRVG